MTTRNKVTSTHVENGIAELKCYTAPDADGTQHVDVVLHYDIRDLSTPTIMDLAAFGFCSVAGNRYQRSGDDHPDVPKIANDLFAEMKAGNWKPGKRDTGDNEPSDLVKAIAEATNTPVHLVAHEFETRMQMRNDGSLYRDARGKTRRFFSKAVQAELSADPAIAPILARLESERAKATLAAAKANKSPSKLSNLFPVPTAAAAQ